MLEMEEACAEKIAAAYAATKKAEAAATAAAEKQGAATAERQVQLRRGKFCVLTVVFFACMSTIATN